MSQIELTGGNWANRMYAEVDGISGARTSEFFGYTVVARAILDFLPDHPEGCRACRPWVDPPNAMHWLPDPDGPEAPGPYPWLR